MESVNCSDAKQRCSGREGSRAIAQSHRAGTDPPEGVHTSTTWPTRLQTNVTVLTSAPYVSYTDTTCNDTLSYTILTNPVRTEVHTMDATVPSAKLQTGLHVRSRNRYPASSCFVDPQRSDGSHMPSSACWLNTSTSRPTRLQTNVRVHASPSPSPAIYRLT